VLGRALRVGIEPRQRKGRHGPLVHDCPKNIVDRFAQLSAPEQHFLRAVGFHVTALVKLVGLG
jgi:hypothetical protein